MAEPARRADPHIARDLTRVLDDPLTLRRGLDLDAPHRFVLFSDQHKGARDGADAFRQCEAAYTAALAHYRVLAVLVHPVARGPEPQVARCVEADVLPGLGPIVRNDFVRGAVTGVGLLTVLAGLGELGGVLAGRRGSDQPVQEE